MNFFEDATIGETYDIGAVTFTAAEIKRFAAQFDPQPFHMDEEAAKSSLFGALCASGWHTTAAWMRCLVDYRTAEKARIKAAGGRVAQGGPSPGFKDLRWLKPVYAGDTISYRAEVIDKRRSQSRPGWGLVFLRHTGTNQNGERAVSFESSVFVECRD